VISDAAGPLSQSTTAAMSSAVPIRPAGLASIICWSKPPKISLRSF
jgi:hypothetical protein